MRQCWQSSRVFCFIQRQQEQNAWLSGTVLIAATAITSTVIGGIRDTGSPDTSQIQLGSNQPQYCLKATLHSTDPE